MKYLIIGAGGVGGTIGAYLAKGGKDVTLIARGEHLRKIRENGLRIVRRSGDFTVNVKALSMDDYNDSPDVIFVCVKGYSLDDTIPFMKRVANENTIIIPVLNIYGTGSRLQEKLEGILVTDGCTYVAAEIMEPGTILLKGSILRVVYGVRNPDEFRPELFKIRDDLKECDITPVLSDDIKRDALLKFSYVSPVAACGQYYDADADKMQEEGEIRETLIKLFKEMDNLANAMDIHFLCDIVKTNLEILSALEPNASTSMQRDIRAGKNSEVDGLVYEVVRLGEKYRVEVPTYRMISEALREKGYK